MSVPVPFHPLSASAPRRSAAKNSRLTALALALLAVSSPLAATTFCVNTSAELQTALSIAASNGVDDTIHLLKGTFIAPSGGFNYTSSEAKNLTLVGGYFFFLGNCARLETSPFGTVLDGGDLERVLKIQIDRGAGGTGSPLVHIEGIKIAHGSGIVGQAGVGLRIATLPDSVSPTVEVHGNAFVGNDTVGPDGGVDIEVGNAATVRVTGNLFVANHANASASALYLSGGNLLDAAINNNTFANNLGATTVLGLNTSSPTATVWLSNNIFWGNGGDYDINWSGIGTTAFVANDYPRPLSFFPTMEEVRFQIDPKFVDPATNWDLKPDSPLAGMGASPPQGGFGTTDILGRPRVAGAYADLGAYEIQLLTSDSFESGNLAVWSAKRP